MRLNRCVSFILTFCSIAEILNTGLLPFFPICAGYISSLLLPFIMAVQSISMPSLKTFEDISHALNVPLKAIFDFEYPQKPKDQTSEREIDRIVNLLKTKKIEEIKVGFLILKNVFRVIKNL